MNSSFAQSSKVIWVAFFSNLILAIIKIAAGLLGRSSALIAEGINSSSDVLVSIIMLVSLRIARRPKDKEHPYGHGKAETIAAGIVGFAILGLSVTVMYGAAASLALPRIIPSIYTIYVAGLAIVVKEFLYKYTLRKAEQMNSIVLSAAAADHRSDQYSALTALVAIASARSGLPILDPLAAALIALMIAYHGWKVLSASAYQLMDGQAEDKTINEIIDAVLSIEKVRKVKEIHGRIAGRGIYVDLTILMHPDTTLEVSHKITEEVEDSIRKKVPTVLGVVTHVEPFYDKKQY